MFACSMQIGAVTRDQDQRGDVAREAPWPPSPGRRLEPPRNDRDRLRHLGSRRMELAGKEVANVRRDLGRMGLQREMPGVEEPDDRIAITVMGWTAPRRHQACQDGVVETASQRRAVHGEVYRGFGASHARRA